ncbi:hypothetical protein PENTCL1PPCAC_30217, partial [Pristionchus entomophagus]
SVAAQAAVLQTPLLQVVPGTAAGIPMPPGAPSTAQIQEMVGGPSYMPWPSHRPAVNLPFFQCDMIKNVNLDIGPSWHSGGLDLPFNDITTLRFFYNLGVQQSRVILLSLHFVQVYYESSLRQKQRLPSAGTSAAASFVASTHTTPQQQQQQHIQAQQRKSVHAAAAIAAQQDQRNQQAPPLSSGSGSSSQQPVFAHDAGIPGRSVLASIIAQETAPNHTTGLSDAPAAAAAAGSPAHEATFSAARATAVEMADAASFAAIQKQKASLSTSGIKTLKVTLLNNLVLKLASTKHDRQRQQKQQSGCPRNRSLDAPATVESTRSAIPVSLTQELLCHLPPLDPLRVEHAHRSQQSAMPNQQRCQHQREAGGMSHSDAHVLLSPKRHSSPCTTQPPAHEHLATDKQGRDNGPALAPMLMVAYFNTHIEKTKSSLQPPSAVSAPTVHSNGIPVSHGDPSPPEQHQKVPLNDEDSHAPLQLEHADRPEQEATQQQLQQPASHYSAIDDTTAYEASDSHQPQESQKPSEGRTPVNSISWSIHNILNDTPTTSKNGLLAEECGSRKRKELPSDRTIIEPISQMLGSYQIPTFYSNLYSSIKRTQQDAIHHQQGDPEKRRLLDTTTPSLNQASIDQSIPTVSAATNDESEMARTTSTGQEEPSSENADDCANGSVSPSDISVSGTRPEVHHNASDDECITDDETHRKLASSISSLSQTIVAANKGDESDVPKVTSMAM